MSVFFGVFTLAVGCWPSAAEEVAVHEPGVESPDASTVRQEPGEEPGAGSTRSVALTNYRLDAVPLLSVGGEATGPTADMFRVSAAVVLEDGRLYVAGGGARVFAFRPDGTYQRTFGGVGQGPGEFGRVNWMRRSHGDTLIVWDQTNSRLSFFDADGAFVRTQRSSARTVHGVLPSGEVVGLRVYQNAASGEILTRLTTSLTISDSADSVLAVLGDVPGFEILDIPQRRIAFSIFMLPRPHFAVGDSVIYVAHGDESEVLAYSTSGGPPRRIVFEQQLTPLTAREVLEYLEMVPGLAGRATLSDLEAFPEGRSYPAVTDLLLADTGELWVQGTILEEASATREWYVLSPSGQLMGTASMTWFQPLQIGDRWVLGVSRDSLGVERVEVRRLLQDSG